MYSFNFFMRVIHSASLKKYILTKLTKLLKQQFKNIYKKQGK